MTKKFTNDISDMTFRKTLAGNTYTVSEHDLLQGSMIGDATEMEEGLGISSMGIKEIIHSNNPSQIHISSKGVDSRNGGYAFDNDGDVEILIEVNDANHN
jgi:hypothetical protein